MKELIISSEEITTQKNNISEIKTKFTGRFIHDEVMLVPIILGKIKQNKKDINYLEIGVHNGASFCSAIYSNSNINCYGIDLWEDVNVQAYKNIDNLTLERTLKNVENSNRYNNFFKLFKGNTFKKESINFAKNIGKIDLLFLDGDHSYNGVKTDFTNYSPLVESGGYIIFDDYSPGHDGIIRFCDSISKEEFRHMGAVNLTKNPRIGSYLIQKV